MRQKRIIIHPTVHGGTKKIMGEMEDERHHITIELLVDEKDFKIRNIELILHRISCATFKDCQENLERLVGVSFLDPYFRPLLMRTIGGERRCFYILELLHKAQDYTRSLVMDSLPDDDGSYTISQINQKGKVRCIGYLARRETELTV